MSRLLKDSFKPLSEKATRVGGLAIQGNPLHLPTDRSVGWARVGRQTGRWPGGVDARRRPVVNRATFACHDRAEP